MLNLSCIICTELFGHTDDVHFTLCGHMFHYACLTQWLKRCKTCPHCRSKCSEQKIYRAYFNIANLDTSHVDVGSLQEQLVDSKLQLQMKEKELKKADEEIKTLKGSQKKCMKTITGLEDKLKKNDFLLLSYVEQIKMLKSEAKILEDLRKEVKSLKDQLAAVEIVNKMISASNAEADKIVKEENDPHKLGICLVTLRRELRNCEKKKNDARNVLRVVQNDLRREIQCKKKLEERISHLESECYRLTGKLQTFENPSPSTSKSAHNILSINGDMAQNTSRKEDIRKTISPTIKESVRKIERADSPYLNIKSSSVGLMPYAFKRNKDTVLTGKDINTVLTTTTRLTKIKVSPAKATNSESKLARKMSSDLTEKYSILKKPRLALPAANNTAVSTGGAMRPFKSNLVLNGFGGSEKIDPFEIRASDDEDVHILDSIIPNEKSTDNAKGMTSSNAKSNFVQLKRMNSAPGTSLSDRLKSGGLRNFTFSKP